MIYRIVSITLFCLGLFCLAQAQVPMTGAGKGAPGGGGGGSYIGPGDLGITTPLAWSGLRAFSSATRGNAAINVCNVADVACADMISDATTGALVITTIGGSDCSIVVCTVKKIYDQTAGGNCTGSCDLVQNTIASRATLTVSCSGLTSSPCLTFNGTSAVYQSPLSFTGPSQPYVFNYVFNHTFTAARQDLGPSVGVNLSGAANEVFCVFGSFDQLASGSGLDGNWGSLSVLGNSTSSDIHINSTAPNIVDCGNGTLTTQFQLGGASSFLNGSVVEVGAWNDGPSSSTMDTLSANAHTFWGF